MKKKLNLRNKIVRAVTYLIVYITIGGFYGWLGAEFLSKLFM